jgi:ABC-type branched-subunit amino acid transport system substrate-binding protein
MSAGGVGHRFGARRERRAGRRRAWFSSAGVLAVGVALAVSACASSSSSGGSASGGGSASAGSGSSASGSALKIMAFGQFQASTFSYPEGRDAILAAVKYYNAHGGFSGHQVQVTVCNDQGNPNLARQCAQQAVSDHDVAVLGSYSQQGPTVLPILQAAHIAYVGATAQSPADTTSSVSFPLEGLNQVVFGGIGYGATITGCKKAGILIENYGTTTPLAEQSVEAGMAINGGKVVKIENTGSNLSSYAPAISVMESAGAQCLATIMPPDQIPVIFQEMRQSADPKIPMINAQDSFSTAALQQLGSVADGMILSSSTYPPSSTKAPVPMVVSEIKKYVPSAAISQFSLQGWAAVDLLRDALAGVSGTVTGQALLKAFSSLSNASTGGLYPPYTTTSPGPVPNAPRIFLTKVLVFKVGPNGTETPVSNGFVSVVKK